MDSLSFGIETSASSTLTDWAPHCTLTDSGAVYTVLPEGRAAYAEDAASRHTVY